MQYEAAYHVEAGDGIPVSVFALLFCAPLYLLRLLRIGRINDGDKWEIMQKLLPLPQKVPVGAVMTLPATG